MSILCFDRFKVRKFLDENAEYIKDKNGDLVPDSSSAENNEYEKYQEEQDQTQKGILGALTGMPVMLGGLFSKLFGDKEDKKENIFTKIWKFLTGDGSSGISLKSILSSVALGLVGLGVTGGLDDVASKVTNGAFGSHNANDTITVKDPETGENIIIQTDKDGNPITDDNGNYISSTGESVDKKSYLQKNGSLATMDLKDRLIYNTVRGTVTGKGSIAGFALKTNKLTRSFYRASKTSAEQTTKGLSKIMATATDTAALADITDKVIDSVTKWTDAIRKVPFLSKYADKLDDLGLAVASLVEDYLPKAGKSLTKISNAFAKLNLVVLVATTIADFTTGYQDASTTLKIKEEDVTIPYRLISGLIRTVKNFIPIIGTFIPDSAVVDLFVNHVAKWFGISVGDLKNKRDAAQIVLDEYNAANNTDLTWSEYNKQIEGNYTWSEKIGNGISSIRTNIKEKGLGRTVTDGIKNSKAVRWVTDKAGKVKNFADNTVQKVSSGINSAYDWVSDKYNNAVDWVQGGIKSVSNSINEKLDPIKEIGSYAKESVKHIWSEIVSGEDKGTTDAIKIDKNDPYGHIKHIIYNIVNIALNTTIGGIFKSARKLWEIAIKPALDAVKTIGTGIGETSKNLISKAWNGELIEAFTDSSGDAKTGITGVDLISKFVNGVTKFALSIPALISSGAGFIVRNFDKFVDGVKSIGSGMKNTATKMITNAWKGNYKNALTAAADSKAKSDNPFIKTISSVANGVTSAAMATPTLLAAAGGLVVNGFKSFINGAKTVGSSMSSMVSNIMTKATEGKNPSSYIFTMRDSSNTGNSLIDTISKVVNTVIKVPLTPVAFLTAGVNFLKDKVIGFFDKIAKAGKLSSTDEKLIEDAKEGDVSIFTSQYWKYNYYCL